MSTFDPTFPAPDPSPEHTPAPAPSFDPSIPVFTIPDNVPPPGPVIELPPIEVMPHPADEPIGDPDEGGEEDDFAKPPDVEPLIEGGDVGSDQVVAAGEDAGGTDLSDGSDASSGGGDGGGDDTGGGGGGDSSGGADAGGGGDAG